MPQTQNNMAAEGAAGAAGARLATEAAPRGRIVILNALPLNALPRAHIRLDMLPVNIVDLGHWIHRRLAEGFEIVHFVRHQATIQALRRELGIPLPLEPNAGLYQYTLGDILVVVTLRAPVRGQEQAQVRIEDLEFWIVTVL